MKKIVLKVFIIYLILLLFISLYCTVVSEATGLAHQFSGSENPEGTKEITSIIGKILEIVRNVGAGIAVLILLTLGCKYMLSSASDRAEIKKHAVIYVIGAVVLFASSAIADILKKFATSSTSATKSS